MFKKGWVFVSALPRIFHARVRLGRTCPTIGVAVSDAWPDRFQFRRLPYDLALARAGARVVTLVPGHFDQLEERIQGIHGLVLAGGEDVHPRYHAGSGQGVRDTHIDRDIFELALLEKAAAYNLPTLCICRGAQLLAAWAGGSLESHDHDTERMTLHFSTFKRLAWHHVDIEPGTRLWHIFNGKPLYANSFHHQAITDPGRLRIAAMTEKGNIEGVELPGDRFVIGVQWHPELQAIVNSAHQRLFNVLVDEARKRRYGEIG